MDFLFLILRSQSMFFRFILCLMFLISLFQNHYGNILLQTDSTQNCTGSLGDNIFTDGDFGSGTSNLLTNNPGIAPGYSYTSNPPPRDGQYVITNNTGQWGQFVWHLVADKRQFQ